MVHNIKAEVRAMQEDLLGEILHNEIKPHTITQLLHTVAVRSLDHSFHESR